MANAKKGSVLVGRRRAPQGVFRDRYHQPDLHEGICQRDGPLTGEGLGDHDPGTARRH